MNEISLKAIGIIHSPFENADGMPIQASTSKAMPGRVEICPEYTEAIKDLDGFSHIILIYHFHKSEKTELTVIPFLDDQPRGVFSTRAPVRPNHIGLSVVQLEKIKNNFLYIKNLDVLNGTPLIDIKPYISDFDHYENIRKGWLENKTDHPVISDKRFNKNNI